MQENTRRKNWRYFTFKKTQEGKTRGILPSRKHKKEKLEVFYLQENTTSVSLRNRGDRYKRRRPHGSRGSSSFSGPLATVTRIGKNLSRQEPSQQQGMPIPQKIQDSSCTSLLSSSSCLSVPSLVSVCVCVPGETSSFSFHMQVDGVPRSGVDHVFVRVQVF